MYSRCFSTKKSTITKPKYRRLTYDDRRVIENMCKAKKTQSEIGKALGVSQSTIVCKWFGGRDWRDGSVRKRLCSAKRRLLRNLRVRGIRVFQPLPDFRSRAERLRRRG